MSNATAPDPLLTYAEAAEYLGLPASSKVVRRAVARHKLESIRLGARTVRIRRSALDAYLRARTVEPREVSR